MVQYNIEALKSMVDSLTFNIKMFQGYGEQYENRVADMVKERRDLAALVENDGVPMKGVYVDGMSYSASLPGADTSWWTKGT